MRLVRRRSRPKFRRGDEFRPCRLGVSQFDGEPAARLDGRRFGAHAATDRVSQDGCGLPIAAGVGMPRGRGAQFRRRLHERHRSGLRAVSQPRRPGVEQTTQDVPAGLRGGERDPQPGLLPVPHAAERRARDAHPRPTPDGLGLDCVWRARHAGSGHRRRRGRLTTGLYYSPECRTPVAGAASRPRATKPSVCVASSRTELAAPTVRYVGSVQRLRDPRVLAARAFSELPVQSALWPIGQRRSAGNRQPRVLLLGWHMPSRSTHPWPEHVASSWRLPTFASP